MGYNTNYILECSDENVMHELSKSNEELVEFLFFSNGKLQGSCKWYDHEYDMRCLSEKYRGVIFTLHGAGENKSDLWRKYFLNGKMQTSYARIEYDCFDTSKLQ